MGSAARRRTAHLGLLLLLVGAARAHPPGGAPAAHTQPANRSAAAPPRPPRLPHAADTPSHSSPKPARSARFTTMGGPQPPPAARSPPAGLAARGSSTAHIVPPSPASPARFAAKNITLKSETTLERKNSVPLTGAVARALPAAPLFVTTTERPHLYTRSPIHATADRIRNGPSRSNIKKEATKHNDSASTVHANVDTSYNMQLATDERLEVTRTTTTTNKSSQMLVNIAELPFTILKVVTRTPTKTTKNEIHTSLIIANIKKQKTLIQFPPNITTRYSKLIQKMTRRVQETTGMTKTATEDLADPHVRKRKEVLPEISKIKHLKQVESTKIVQPIKLQTTKLASPSQTSILTKTKIRNDELQRLLDTEIPKTSAIPDLNLTTNLEKKSPARQNKRIYTTIAQPQIDDIIIYSTRDDKVTAGTKKTVAPSKTSEAAQRKNDSLLQVNQKLSRQKTTTIEQKKLGTNVDLKKYTTLMISTISHSKVSPEDNRTIAEKSNRAPSDHVRRAGPSKFINKKQNSIKRTDTTKINVESKKVKSRNVRVNAPNDAGSIRSVISVTEANGDGMVKNIEQNWSRVKKGGVHVNLPAGAGAGARAGSSELQRVTNTAQGRVRAHAPPAVGSLLDSVLGARLLPSAGQRTTLRGNVNIGSTLRSGRDIIAPWTESTRCTASLPKNIRLKEHSTSSPTASNPTGPGGSSPAGSSGAPVASGWIGLGFPMRRGARAGGGGGGEAVLAAAAAALARAQADTLSVLSLLHARRDHYADY